MRGARAWRVEQRRGLACCAVSQRLLVGAHFDRRWRIVGELPVVLAVELLSHWARCAAASRSPAADDDAELLDPEPS